MKKFNVTDVYPKVYSGWATLHVRLKGVKQLAIMEWDDLLTILKKTKLTVVPPTRKGAYARVKP